MVQVQNVNDLTTGTHSFKDALQVVSLGLKSGEKIFVKVELSFRRDSAECWLVKNTSDLKNLTEGPKLARRKLKNPVWMPAVSGNFFLPPS